MDELRAYDTFGALTNHFETKINTFLSQLLTENVIESSYKSSIATIWKDRVAKHQEYTAKIPFSDFKVFDFI